ncbi:MULTISPECIES: hypothetical protein [unclassified Sphingobium]|uniref:hypothetical protein n=1 Tax=unclassified Sphingobium TaxID=2611147 RepID=UPI0035A58FFC
MTFEEDLLQRVSQSPIAASLARWNGAPTIHWGDRPEGAGLTAIVFTMIDEGLDYTHGGRDKLRIAQVQADTMAANYGDARAVADALGLLLEGTAEVNGRTFTHGFIDLERDIPVVGVAGARSVYGRTQRFSIYHKE